MLRAGRLALAAVVLCACGPAPDAVPGSSPTPAMGVPQVGVVDHVVDGDTLDVVGVGRIRVIGIDTPERGDCGYDSATWAMSALVLDRRVRLTPGAATDADTYGRLLRYVDVASPQEGSADAGLELIRMGLAVARYDSRDGYGHHPREEAYVAADQDAPDRGCFS